LHCTVLQDQLEAAIREERYEEAARIRQQLQGMEVSYHNVTTSSEAITEGIRVQVQVRG
jgi:protein-arginine kinase activator protein McsA